MTRYRDAARALSEMNRERRDEMTTTMTVPGYSTPFAFKADDEDEEDELRERLRRINDALGYTDNDDLTGDEALLDLKQTLEPVMQRDQDIAEMVRRTLLRPVRDRSL